MGDEYQLRKDIDQLWNEMYRIDDGTLRLVDIGDNAEIRRLHSIDKILEYYNLLTVSDDLIKKLNRSELLNLTYPVGSIYLTGSSTFDPNVGFGGNWQIIDSPFQGILMWERIDDETE